jgi:hypothetical protein
LESLHIIRIHVGHLGLEAIHGVELRSHGCVHHRHEILPAIHRLRHWHGRHHLLWAEVLLPMSKWAFNTVGTSLTYNNYQWETELEKNFKFEKNVGIS